MECYICYQSERPDDPLKSPCKCKGSMQYVHESCLAKWLQTTNSRRCRHCHYEYRTDCQYDGVCGMPGISVKSFYEPAINMCTFYMKILASALLLIAIHISWITFGSYGSYAISGMLTILTLTAISPIVRNYVNIVRCYQFTNAVLTRYTDTKYKQLLWWFLFLGSLLISSGISTHEIQNTLIERPDRWRRYARTIKNYEQ